VQRLTIKNLLKHLTFRQLLRQVINNLEEAEHSQQEKSVQFTGLGNGEVNIATQVEG
jgi:phage protein U